MDYLSAFQISGFGMDVERLRLDLTALNIANANLPISQDGQLYAAKSITAKSAASFSVMLNANQQFDAKNMLPKIGVTESTEPPKYKHEPGHPSADSKGMVAYPNVNHVNEMVNMVLANRAYEANVRAMNTAKQMALNALQIGRNN